MPDWGLRRYLGSQAGLASFPRKLIRHSQDEVKDDSSMNISQSAAEQRQLALTVDDRHKPV